ncbi:SpaA isopeptide-forming pilin-related protein [Streptomyces sp. NPDC057413]|uniref:SpaA isopeptide-forming pilin-related protein n=1 Tax=Streptomyces sp. NPDC057413 TaxID=3346124 RepID=UPI0036C65C6E
MHARIVRGTLRSTAIAAALTGTLTWAPTATAQPAQPTPSTTALTESETPAPDAGSVTLTTKDPAGDVLQGASYLLLDATGQEAGHGTTDAQGTLTFPGLAPGVYRLKETAAGSPPYDVVADQDVIVTPGGTTRLAIIAPFKSAHVLLQAKDDKTGKLLSGVTVNIGSGDTTLLTLTTGPKGTATGDLPVSSRKAEFWIKETKAPAGYDLYTRTKTFTAGPGAPVTVTVTNSKRSTSPHPAPTKKPTHTPSTPGDKPTSGTSGGAGPSPTTSDTSDSAPSAAPVQDTTDDASPTAPVGSLAHTGADASPWLLGGAGLLVAGGTAAVIAARRRARTEREDTPADN